MKTLVRSLINDQYDVYALGRAYRLNSLKDIQAQYNTHTVLKSWSRLSSDY